MPGLQDAGLIWQTCNDAFLLKYGFTQSSVDRRCFYLHRGGETMIVCVYVDDSFIWCSSDELWEDFYEKWSETFPPSEEGRRGAAAARVSELEFCGLTVAQKASGFVEFSCGKLVLDLARKLLPHRVPVDFATPLSSSGLQQLRAPPSAKEPLLSDQVLIEQAMSIVGLGGWIAQSCFPAALLPFIALAHQMSCNFKTTTWTAVLR
jgi:hypothetical protein